MENNFLAINKQYLGMGLKSIDILIIAQIEEFQRNKCQCYITNEQFAEMFGESRETIKRAITKLENLSIVVRETVFIKGNGKGNRQRTLSVNPRSKWKAHNELTNTMEGSKTDNGRLKNAKWKAQNEPIKEKEKENKKENKGNSLSFGVGSYQQADTSKRKSVDFEYYAPQPIQNTNKYRRALGDIEDEYFEDEKQGERLMLVPEAKKRARNYCIAQCRAHLLDDIYDAIYKADAITQATLDDIIKKAIDNDI